MPRTFAYCRVSTTDQTTDNQVREIEAAGFKVDPKRAIAETVSGSVAAANRKGFSKLMDRMEDNDVLVVTKLDRLGRNAMDVRATVEALAKTGVRVHCLALGGVDLTSAAGKMTMGVLNAVAEFERDMLIELTQAALSRARAEGKTLGRPVALSPEDQRTVLQRRSEGVSLGTLAKEYGVSRAAIQRVGKRRAGCGKVRRGPRAAEMLRAIRGSACAYDPCAFRVPSAVRTSSARSWSAQSSQSPSICGFGRARAGSPLDGLGAQDSRSTFHGATRRVAPPSASSVLGLCRRPDCRESQSSKGQQKGCIADKPPSGC